MFSLCSKTHLYLLSTKKHSTSLNDVKENDVFMPQGLISLNVRLVLKTPSTLKSVTVVSIFDKEFTPRGLW